MKIQYIKDWTGHKLGDIIDTDNLTAKWMVDKEFCVYFDEKNHEQRVYTDNSGKVYTTEEVEKMDKRTNIYKEIQANLKK